MDYIRKYDIELEKEQYYAGEILRGWVVIENAENLRITGMIINHLCMIVYYTHNKGTCGPSKHIS